MIPHCLSLKSIEDLSLNLMEDLSLKSMEDLSLKPIEDLSLKPMGELLLKPIDELSLKSMDDLLLKSMEDLLVYLDQLLFEQLQINLRILCLSSNDTFVEKHFVGRTFRRQNTSLTKHFVER